MFGAETTAITEFITVILILHRNSIICYFGITAERNKSVIAMSFIITRPHCTCVWYSNANSRCYRSPYAEHGMARLWMRINMLIILFIYTFHSFIHFQIMCMILLQPWISFCSIKVNHNSGRPATPLNKNGPDKTRVLTRLKKTL